VRAEGATYAVYSFVRKVGQALGAAVVSWTIGIVGYQAFYPLTDARYHEITAEIAARDRATEPAS
jgi:Na+/melibiose symporter-like transporter